MTLAISLFQSTFGMPWECVASMMSNCMHKKKNKKTKQNKTKQKNIEHFLGPEKLQSDCNLIG